MTTQDLQESLQGTPTDLLVHACLVNDAVTSHPHFMELIRRGGGINDPRAIQWARTIIEFERSARDLERIREGK